MTKKAGGRGGRLSLFRARLVFSFDDIRRLLHVQNSLGARQRAPLPEDNETSMEGLLRSDFAAGRRRAALLLEYLNLSGASGIIIEAARATRIRKWTNKYSKRIQRIRDSCPRLGRVASRGEPSGTPRP